MRFCQSVEEISCLFCLDPLDGIPTSTSVIRQPQRGSGMEQNSPTNLKFQQVVQLVKGNHVEMLLFGYIRYSEEISLVVQARSSSDR